MYSNNYEPDDPRTTEVPETMDLSEIDARLVDQYLNSTMLER